MTPSDYEKVSEYVEEIDNTISTLVTTESLPRKNIIGRKNPQVQQPAIQPTEESEVLTNDVEIEEIQ